jgi:hypothetical protein
VELVASDSQQGQKQTFVITFTHWGAILHLTKPSVVTPISSTKLPS